MARGSFAPFSVEFFYLVREWKKQNLLDEVIELIIIIKSYYNNKKLLLYRILWTEDII